MRVLSVDRAITADGELDACLKSGRPKRLYGGIALRLALSVGAGWLLFLSFPPRTLWFLAPVAIALLTAVLQGRSLRAGFGFGYAAGLGFFVPLLPWVGAYVGATPWLALAAIEALAFGVFGVLAVARRSRSPFPRCGLRVHGSPPKHFVAEFRSAVSRGGVWPSGRRTVRCCRWLRSQGRQVFPS